MQLNHIQRTLSLPLPLLYSLYPLLPSTLSLPSPPTFLLWMGTIYQRVSLDLMQGMYMLSQLVYLSGPKCQGMEGFYTQLKAAFIFLVFWTTPGGQLRGCSWLCTLQLLLVGLGNHLGCRKLNLSQLRARQTSYPLYSLSLPSLRAYFWLSIQGTLLTLPETLSGTKDQTKYIAWKAPSLSAALSIQLSNAIDYLLHSWDTFTGICDLKRCIVI